MADRIVSVKMPASLVRELRHLTKEEHFLDLSEQIRSIVRQRCLQHTYANDDLQKLREAIEQQVRSSSTQLKKEQILRELAKLLEERP